VIERLFFAKLTCRDAMIAFEDMSMGNIASKKAFEKLISNAFFDANTF